MDKSLRLLESFAATGSDGKRYDVRAYEHLARLDAAPDLSGQWESTGLSEYKLSDGRHVRVDADGTMSLPEEGVTLKAVEVGVGV